MQVQDFVNWCNNKGLINITEDGTVRWADSLVEGDQAGPKNPSKGQKPNYKEKMDGARSQVDDLSGDYEGHACCNGNVWPYKVLPKKAGEVQQSKAGKS
jgi:hypothetical protein